MPTGRWHPIVSAIVDMIVPALERQGFRVREEGDDLVRLSGHQFDELTVRLLDTGDGRTLVVVHGVASLRVRRAFARLRD